VYRYRNMYTCYKNELVFCCHRRYYKSTDFIVQNLIYLLLKMVSHLKSALLTYTLGKERERG